LEYEKTEVNSALFYKSAAEREKLLMAEREFITRRVLKIIEFKKSVCSDSKNTPSSSSTRRVSILHHLISWHKMAFWHCEEPSDATWNVSPWLVVERR